MPSLQALKNTWTTGAFNRTPPSASTSRRSSCLLLAIFWTVQRYGKCFAGLAGPHDSTRPSVSSLPPQPFSPWLLPWPVSDQPPGALPRDSLLCAQRMQISLGHAWEGSSMTPLRLRARCPSRREDLAPGAPLPSGLVPLQQQHGSLFATAHGTPAAPHPFHMWLPPGAVPPHPPQRRSMAPRQHDASIRATCSGCATRTLWTLLCSRRHRGPDLLRTPSVPRTGCLGEKAQLFPLRFWMPDLIRSPLQRRLLISFCPRHAVPSVLLRVL